MEVNFPTQKRGIYSPRLYSCICMWYPMFTEFSSGQRWVFDQNTELTYLEETPQKGTERTETVEE